MGVGDNMSKCLHCDNTSCEPPCGLNVCQWHCVVCYRQEGKEGCCEDMKPAIHKQMRNELMLQDKQKGLAYIELCNKYQLDYRTIYGILKTK